MSSLGFAEGPNTLGIVPGMPRFEGVPPISFDNFTIGVVASGGLRYNNIFQWADDFSKIIGTHTLKFGGDFHYDQVNMRGCCGSRNGTFSFDGEEI